MNMPGRPKRLKIVGLSWRRTASLIGLALVSSLAFAENAPVPNAEGRAITSHSAGDIDRSREELIRALVELTDSPQVKAVLSEQLIDRVSGAIQMFGPTLDAQTIQVVQQQTRAVIGERIADGDALYSVLAPIYQKHFNLVELNQLVTFYQSPLGQKLVRVSPQLLTETLDLGSQWGLSLVPEIIERVDTRLNDRPIP